MSNWETKGQSPFYPGQPVPVKLFVGRDVEVTRIKVAAKQVALGKPQAIFITGEYGIGKSSLARFVRVAAEEDPGLLGFHVMLGEAESLDDLAIRTVQTVVETPAMRPGTLDAIRNLLAEYIGEQSLFGFKFRLDKLRTDAPSIAKGFLPFLRKLRERSREKYKGLLLIFDEINGMAGKDSFARFLKNLVDENALSDAPLPLLLILCGTQERHKEIIRRHQPVERIFEVAHIGIMSAKESGEFFQKAFASVGMRAEKDAEDLLTSYSGGLPKLMHLVGDSAYWIAKDIVTPQAARQAILAAAEDVGRKFVEQQVYRTLRSKDYKSILAKLAKEDFDLVFAKKQMEKGLTQEECRKFNNFLQRMKRLNVLAPGEERGEYVFRDRLTRLYLRMEAIQEKEK